MKVDLSKVKTLTLSGPGKFIGGVIVGACVIFLKENRHMLLVLTKEDIRELRVNTGCAVYDTKHGPIFVGMNNFSEGE